MSVFTDDEIDEFVHEGKPLPDGYRQNLIGKKMKEDGQQKRSEIKIPGELGNLFYIIVRLSKQNPLDFSVILALEKKETTGRFLLRRYNGKSHWHSNKLENTPPFRDFHIHYATQRYQEAQLNEEHYAEATDRYTELDGALTCLIQDCNCTLPPGETQRLF